MRKSRFTEEQIVAIVLESEREQKVVSARARGGSTTRNGRTAVSATARRQRSALRPHGHEV